MRIDDKQRWCYEHIAALGARAEMLANCQKNLTGTVSSAASPMAIP
jgi:hypothetical protein